MSVLSRRSRLSLPFLLTAAVTVACSVPTVDGRAVVNADEVAQARLEALNPGNYPTTPQPLGAAGVDGPLVEGQRMAENVVGPWEVDRGLIKSNVLATLAWQSATAIGSSLPEPVATAAAARGFLTGFTSSRTAPAPENAIGGMQIAVLRFPTVEDAATATREMFDAQFATGAQPATVPGHPDAMAGSATNPDGWVGLFSFTPRGVFVLYAFANARTGGLDAASRAVARALDLQKPRIDEFRPTAPNDFADLPLDPDGLLARMLPPPAGRINVNDGSWPARAALHNSVDPFTTDEVHRRAGVKRVGYRLDTVVETTEPSGANTVYEAMLGEPAPGEVPVEAVPGVKTSKCFDNGAETPGVPRAGGPRFTCVFTVDRYVVSIAAPQIADARQRIAAEYLLLTAK